MAQKRRDLSKTGPTQVTPTIPPEVRDLLGPAPVTRFESADHYERVLAQVAAAVQPRDFIEWAWVKDIVDLSWDAARARRAKTAQIALAHQTAVQKVLQHIDPPDMSGMSYLEDYKGDAASIIADEDPDETRAFNKDLKARLGLEPSAIGDLAYALALPEIEKLERMIDNAMSRRDAILREIDRRRESLAKALRAATPNMDDAIDAEFE